MFYYTVDRIVKNWPFQISSHVASLTTFVVGTTVWGSIAYLLWNPANQAYIEAHPVFKSFSQYLPIIAILDMCMITFIDKLLSKKNTVIGNEDDTREPLLLEEPERLQTSQFDTSEEESRIVQQFVDSSCNSNMRTSEENTEEPANTDTTKTYDKHTDTSTMEETDAESRIDATNTATELSSSLSSS